MALYEAVFIIRQDLSAENVDDLSSKMSDVISQKGGKVISQEYWGLRNLSYKINKANKGHYVLLNIEANNDTVDELNRVVSINEDIVRFVIFSSEGFSKDPSILSLSVKAKDYKKSDTDSDKKPESLKDLDRRVDSVAINI